MQLFKGKKMEYKSRIGHWKNVTMWLNQYSNGRLGIQLMVPMEDMDSVEEEHLEPLMTCTMNLPDSECAANECYVKDYSENAGCKDWLIAQGVIEPTPVGTGWQGDSRYAFTLAFMMEVAAALTAGKQVRK